MSTDLAKKEFSLFFSGVESDSYFDIVMKESNNILMSYLYIQKKPKKFLQERFAEHPNVRLLLDSGVHTFYKKIEDYKKKDLAWWENYLEKYTQFARDNREHVFAVVELDIDGIVGVAKVNEFREKYFKPLEADGIQVCYVWHQVRGEVEWERMCQTYSYVGFSLQEQDMTVEKCVRLSNIARKYGARIHG